MNVGGDDANAGAASAGADRCSDSISMLTPMNPSRITYRNVTTLPNCPLRTSPLSIDARNRRRASCRLAVQRDLEVDVAVAPLHVACACGRACHLRCAAGHGYDGRDSGENEQWRNQKAAADADQSG